MQLVPAGNAHTYHTKNSLDVSMANGDDKRGYTVVLASAASGKMLPLQVIYGGASHLWWGRGLFESFAQRAMPRNCSCQRLRVCSDTHSLV